MDNLKYRVFEVLKQIPKGKVITYGQIAKYLKIKSPRLVGRILHKNKDSKNIPCHRVVFTDGSLSNSYAFGGEKKQRERLKNEGVRFVDNKIDLEKYRFILQDHIRLYSKDDSG